MPEGSSYPVELRLFGVIVFNALVFIMGKMIMKSYGINMLNMMNSTAANNVAPGSQKPKAKRMEEPDLTMLK